MKKVTPQTFATDFNNGVELFFVGQFNPSPAPVTSFEAVGEYCSISCDGGQKFACSIERIFYRGNLA